MSQVTILYILHENKLLPPLQESRRTW